MTRLLMNYYEVYPNNDEMRVIGYRLDLPLKNKFKEYVTKHKITQSYLAQICNTSIGNINLILNNEHQPTLDLFFRIWANLDYPPINEIFYRVDPNI